MSYSPHQLDSQNESTPLSFENLDSIFRWLQIDCESLFACCQVNKRWCERSLKYLYSRPFDFLRLLNAPESPEGFQLEQDTTDISVRIQLLVLTFVSDEFRGQYGKKTGYIECLRQLDFSYIGSLYGKLSPSRGSYNNDKIQYIFEVSKYCQRLESLVYNEYVFPKQPFSFNNEIQYSKLRRLEFHLDSNHHSILSSKNILDIAQCCRNLRIFLVRARNSFTDSDLAYLIQRQQPNTFRELLIERSQEITFEKTLRVLYTQHKDAFLKAKFIWCNQLCFLNELGLFPRLETLEIANCHHFTDEGLSVSADSFKHLQYLAVRETAITSSKVGYLCKNAGGSLLTLNISVDTQIQPELVRALVTYCPNLRNLAFGLLSYALPDLELLASECVHLQRLILGHPSENDITLVETTLCKVIDAWKELEYIDLGHTPVSRPVIQHLSAQKALKRLRIDFSFQSRIFWMQVATILGERFGWNVQRNDLNIVTFRLD